MFSYTNLLIPRLPFFSHNNRRRRQTQQQHVPSGPPNNRRSCDAVSPAQDTIPCSSLSPTADDSSSASSSYSCLPWPITKSLTRRKSSLPPSISNTTTNDGGAMDVGGEREQLENEDARAPDGWCMPRRCRPAIAVAAVVDPSCSSYSPCFTRNIICRPSVTSCAAATAGQSAARGCVGVCDHTDVVLFGTTRWGGRMDESFREDGESEHNQKQCLWSGSNNKENVIMEEANSHKQNYGHGNEPTHMVSVVTPSTTATMIDPPCSPPSIGIDEPFSSGQSYHILSNKNNHLTDSFPAANGSRTSFCCSPASVNDIASMTPSSASSGGGVTTAIATDGSCTVICDDDDIEAAVSLTYTSSHISRNGTTPTTEHHPAFPYGAGSTQQQQRDGYNGTTTLALTTSSWSSPSTVFCPLPEALTIASSGNINRGIVIPDGDEIISTLSPFASSVVQPSICTTPPPYLSHRPHHQPTFTPPPCSAGQPHHHLYYHQSYPHQRTDDDQQSGRRQQQPLDSLSNYGEEDVYELEEPLGSGDKQQEMYQDVTSPRFCVDCDSNGTVDCATCTYTGPFPIDNSSFSDNAITPPPIHQNTQQPSSPSHFPSSPLFHVNVCSPMSFYPTSPHRVPPTSPSVDSSSSPCDGAVNNCTSSSGVTSTTTSSSVGTVVPHHNSSGDGRTGGGSGVDARIGEGRWIDRWPLDASMWEDEWGSVSTSVCNEVLEALCLTTENEHIFSQSPIGNLSGNNNKADNIIIGSSNGTDSSELYNNNIYNGTNSSAVGEGSCSRSWKQQDQIIYENIENQQIYNDGENDFAKSYLSPSNDFAKKYVSPTNEFVTSGVCTEWCGNDSVCVAYNTNGSISSDAWSDEDEDDEVLVDSSETDDNACCDVLAEIVAPPNSSGCNQQQRPSPPPPPQRPEGQIPCSQSCYSSLERSAVWKRRRGDGKKGGGQGREEKVVLDSEEGRNVCNSYQACTYNNHSVSPVQENNRQEYMHYPHRRVVHQSASPPPPSFDGCPSQLPSPLIRHTPSCLPPPSYQPSSSYHHEDIGAQRPERASGYREVKGMIIAQDSREGTQSGGTRQEDEPITSFVEKACLSVGTALNEVFTFALNPVVTFAGDPFG
eukprot:GHVS01041021.1.p1 GENE.GHVS01041021.1~~GHVS01041021.1.p1  ORF type:complete len:1113 (-),score=250.81 GHVS01041021.1:849-4187(-)